MEVEDMGPVRKSSGGTGKRRRRSSFYQNMDKSARRTVHHGQREQRMQTEESSAKESSKVSLNFLNEHEDFDTFNESDVLLAEFDIETPASPSATTSRSNMSSPGSKKIYHSVIQSPAENCTTDKQRKRLEISSYPKAIENKDNDKTSVIDSSEHDCNQTELISEEEIFLFSSDEDDLFAEDISSNSCVRLGSESSNHNPLQEHTKCEYEICDNQTTSKQGWSQESQGQPVATASNSSTETNNKIPGNRNNSVLDDVTVHEGKLFPPYENFVTGGGSHLSVLSTSADNTQTEMGKTTPKTHIPPGRTRIIDSSSLKDRVKKRLQQNTGLTTPKRNVEEEAKKAALLKARLDASQIRKEGSEVDIGPFYGLPLKVQQLLEKNRGITKLYDWQNECLQLRAVKERKNLIYTLPTSGGKTLVAEVLILKELLCYKRDALLVLPFVSIVQEKVRTISEFATELGFLVEEYAGSKGRFPPINRRKKNSLYIATIEKAHSLVNSLIETERLKSLGLVVVDELHMIGEGGSRGATQEAMLLKLVLSQSDTQIIGMSATLTNIKDLQKFLNAEVYHSDFRPVQLKEYVKLEDNIFQINHQSLDDDGRLVHERIVTFPYSSEVLRQDPDHLLGLVTEVIPDNSCLVFCPTKKNCENVALMLSKLICKYQRHLASVNRDKRKEVLKELHQDGEGKVCQVLDYTIHFGIAYHHSGLTMDERRLIEAAYSEGTLCLLTCTSTLAAGVNLPAKRVILRSPHVGMSLIKYSQYKQMTGRAGRAGIDTSGESILIVQKQDKLKVKELLSGPKDYCHSSLAYEKGKGVRSLLLSAIGLKVVTSTESAFDMMRKSLLQIQAPALGIDTDQLTKDCLQHLIKEELVLQTKTADEEEDGSNTTYLLQVTPLGKATFKGSIDQTYASQLYKDLKTAEESLHLASHLHLLFLVTPYDASISVVPDWNIYFNEFCKLSSTELKVPSIIGVPESYIGLKAAGQSSRKKVCELTIKRFYLTLMLWQLWNQKTVWEVADRFSQPRGFVQNLLSQSAAFASCVFHFCQELDEFWAYQDLFSNFVKRLSYCVTAELIPLMEIPGIKLARAKQLFAAGFKSVTSVAGAEPETLASHVKYLSARAAKQMIAAAKNILEEKTAALMDEVESLVSVPATTPDESLTSIPATTAQ